LIKQNCNLYHHGRKAQTAFSIYRVAFTTCTGYSVPWGKHASYLCNHHNCLTQPTSKKRLLRRTTPERAARARSITQSMSMPSSISAPIDPTASAPRVKMFAAVVTMEQMCWHKTPRQNSAPHGSRGQRTWNWLSFLLEERELRYFYVLSTTMGTRPEFACYPVF
jgi:hypothetical protein